LRRDSSPTLRYSSEFGREDTVEPDERKYWFAAKRYGYGWGLPLTWQGWLVFIGYLVLLMVGGIYVIDLKLHPVVYYVFLSVLTVVLLGIVWKKGEKARWRWGEKE
jgi:hypothetical protein